MNNLFDLDISHENRLLKKMETSKDKAKFLFFRIMGPRLQKRISGLIDLEKIPKVFLHGNPHIDNYAKTFSGEGMVDFDRSRIGPYAWDLVRFMSSLLMVRDGEGPTAPLSPKVHEAFLEGYFKNFFNKDLHYVGVSFLKHFPPSPEEITTRKYLESEIRWAKKMRKNPIAKDDPFMLTILKLYLENRKEESLLNEYEVVEAGISEGSLGKRHYIIALTPKKFKEFKDDILLDIKQTYTEEDDEWFHSPTEHHGLRMMRASNLYAPGVEQRLGFLTHNNIQYWGREIPCYQAKIKKTLSKVEQMDLSYAVGTQLGRGHRRSLKETDPKILEKHLLKNFKIFNKVAHLLAREIDLGFDYFEKTMTWKHELDS